MNKVIFDSANVNASSAFGLGTDEPNWDAMAEEAAFQDALDRGIVISHGSIPAPAPSAKVEGEWTEAEWKRANAFGLNPGNRRRPMVKAEVAPAKVAVETATTKPAGPSLADRLEWSMMTLSTAPVGSYFVQGEPRKFDTTTRKPAPKVAARRSWQECRDAELDAIRPAGQAFDSPEWEGYFSQARVIESRYN